MENKKQDLKDMAQCLTFLITECKSIGTEINNCNWDEPEYGIFDQEKNAIFLYEKAAKSKEIYLFVLAHELFHAKSNIPAHPYHEGNKTYSDFQKYQHISRVENSLGEKIKKFLKIATKKEIFENLSLKFQSMTPDQVFDKLNYGQEYLAHEEVAADKFAIETLSRFNVKIPDEIADMLKNRTLEKMLGSMVLGKNSIAYFLICSDEERKNSGF